MLDISIPLHSRDCTLYGSIHVPVYNNNTSPTVFFSEIKKYIIDCMYLDNDILYLWKYVWNKFDLFWKKNVFFLIFFQSDGEVNVIGKGGLFFRYFFRLFLQDLKNVINVYSELVNGHTYVQRSYKYLSGQMFSIEIYIYKWLFLYSSIWCLISYINNKYII